MTEQLHDEFDPRTESERTVDDLLGAKEQTGLDRQFAKILKSASDLFLNAKQTRKYLVLGEECDLYVRKAVDLGVKRADAVARITDRLNESGLGMADIRVNDWVAVYNLARLCTGQDTVKDMPPEWVGTHAYRTLAILKVAIERDDTEYVFKNHWAAKVQEWLTDGIRGRALEEAVKQHAKDVEEHVRESRKKSLTPEKQHQLEMAELARERDQQIAAINKAAEQIRERAVKANLSPDDLLVTLVNRGIITPPEPVSVPMDPQDMARTMDAEQAAAFAKALIDRGNTAIVMAIASVLTGWLRAHADKAAG